MHPDLDQSDTGHVSIEGILDAKGFRDDDEIRGFIAEALNYLDRGAPQNREHHRDSIKYAAARMLASR